MKERSRRFCRDVSFVLDLMDPDVSEFSFERGEPFFDGVHDDDRIGSFFLGNGHERARNGPLPKIVERVGALVRHSFRNGRDVPEENGSCSSRGNDDGSKLRKVVNVPGNGDDVFGAVPFEIPARQTDVSRFER